MPDTSCLVTATVLKKKNLWSGGPNTGYKYFNDYYCS